MEIILSRGNDKFSKELEKFAEKVASSSNGKITLVKELSKGQFLPSLTISCKGRENIHYTAIPEGPEYGPFMDALKFFHQNDTPLQEEIKVNLKKIIHPLEILVLISPECPNCPNAVRIITSMAVINSKLDVFIIDVTRFPELAVKYGIKSVPAIIIDKSIVLIGQIELDKLTKLLLSKNRPEFISETLINMIDTKRVQEAVKLIIENKEYAKALLPTLKNGEFKDRLPILFLFEEVLEKNPFGLDPIVPDLIKMVDDTDSALVGDIADLLGKIGNNQAIPYLKRLVEHNDPDIAEAAKEAIDEIKTKER
ncbi:MAG: thioredoxin family protein [Thermodesulfobacteriota bacterium]|nr:thioredoxin family protein [Thermodesulfobacteriota bacterium]